MLNLPVIITPLRTYLYGHTSFWTEVICLQHLFTEYLEKYNFLKIVHANSILADVKSIIQLSRQHFFANMNKFELERLYLLINQKIYYLHSLQKQIILLVN